ncbi:MAG: hypothetical protein NTX53_10880 [candidate division WOR-3 bacterium]|nr:hypothetical protein [candidate division WOR-3 bacterium]
MSVEPGRAKGFGDSSVVAAMKHSLELVFATASDKHPTEGVASVRVTSLKTSSWQGAGSATLGAVGGALACLWWYHILWHWAPPTLGWVILGGALATVSGSMAFPDHKAEASAQVEMEIRKHDGTVIRRYDGSGHSREGGQPSGFDANSMAGGALADALNAITQNLTKDRDSIAAELKR